MAAVKKGVESVLVSVLGMLNDLRDGILVYLASNDAVRPDVQNYLRSIVLVI